MYSACLGLKELDSSQVLGRLYSFIIALAAMQGMTKATRSFRPPPFLQFFNTLLKGGFIVHRLHKRTKFFPAALHYLGGDLQ